MKRLLALLLALLTILSGCATAPWPAAGAPTRPLFVLAAASPDPREGRLAVADAATWTVAGEAELPESLAAAISRDPQGRLWVGLDGTAASLDNRVQIFAPDGAPLQELRPCTSPRAGISFAAGRAFVACAERGFFGSVAVVDLATLETVATIELRAAAPEAPLMLIASAADERAVVVAALTSGPAESSYTVLSVIDPQTLALQEQIELGEHTDIWRVIPHEGDFLLLNAASWRQPRAAAGDVLALDLEGEPRLKPLRSAPSPVWGAVVDGALYAYHNPMWNQPNSDQRRSISRLDLRSGAVQTWELPEGWLATDLIALDGELLLAHAVGRDEDGVYSFTLADGTLHQMLEVPYAAQLVGS
jgi:hypothetical protein